MGLLVPCTVARRRARVSARVALFDAAFNPRYKRAPREVVDTSRFVGPGFFPVVTPEYGRIRRKQRLYRMRTHRWAKSGRYPFPTASASRSLFNVQYMEFLKGSFLI
ncbi:uncharacterized protein LOC124690430 [Lolium rigidum]|uniref:uncharacterized protein LOC124690430 n=1 Tax=Lolium rigidum TaxID=89674 RepID=UPI001F5CC102|nr:uncharacterized protein LOC124690430 [Lolium rigidum]